MPIKLHFQKSPQGVFVRSPHGFRDNYPIYTPPDYADIWRINARTREVIWAANLREQLVAAGYPDPEDPENAPGSSFDSHSWIPRYAHIVVEGNTAWVFGYSMINPYYDAGSPDRPDLAPYAPFVAMVNVTRGTLSQWRFLPGEWTWIDGQNQYGANIVHYYTVDTLYTYSDAMLGWPNLYIKYADWDFEKTTYYGMGYTYRDAILKINCGNLTTVGDAVSVGEIPDPEHPGYYLSTGIGGWVVNRHALTYVYLTAAFDRRLARIGFYGGNFNYSIDDVKSQIDTDCDDSPVYWQHMFDGAPFLYSFDDDRVDLSWELPYYNSWTPNEANVIPTWATVIVDGSNDIRRILRQSDKDPLPGSGVMGLGDASKFPNPMTRMWVFSQQQRSNIGEGIVISNEEYRFVLSRDVNKQFLPADWTDWIGMKFQSLRHFKTVVNGFGYGVYVGDPDYIPRVMEPNMFCTNDGDVEWTNRYGSETYFDAPISAQALASINGSEAVVAGHLLQQT